MDSWNQPVPIWSILPVPIWPITCTNLVYLVDTMDSQNRRPGSLSISRLSDAPDSPKRQRRSSRGEFLHCPVSCRHMALAQRSGTCGLAVFLAIHHARKLKQTGSVRLTCKRCATLGITLRQARKGLNGLVGVGLARVTDGGPGRCSTVTLMNPPDVPPEKCRIPVE